MMSWQRVLTYITELQPGLSETFVGVPEEHILACEEGWGFRFPAAYREFLLTLGVDARGYRPLGGSMEWNFYTVLDDLPEDYDPSDLVRVSKEIDDSLTVHIEYYLDMKTMTAGGDGELLAFEWCMAPEREYAEFEERTFLEKVLSVAWVQLDSKRWPHTRRLLSISHGRNDPDQVTAAKAREVLVNFGFHSAIDPTSRISCLATKPSDKASAFIDIRRGAVWVRLAGESPRFLDRVSHVLSDQVPGLELIRK